MLCTGQQHSQGLEDQIAELQGAQAKLMDTVREHQDVHASSQKELQGAIQKVHELEQQCASAMKRADEAVEQAQELQMRLEGVQHQQEVVCMHTLTIYTSTCDPAILCSRDPAILCSCDSAILCTCDPAILCYQFSPATLKHASFNTTFPIASRTMRMCSLLFCQAPCVHSTRVYAFTTHIGPGSLTCHKRHSTLMFEPLLGIA
jgi:hypothetical protein